MARMTRYRRSSMKARAAKQFGNTFVDVLIPGSGIDLAPLTAWCGREGGKGWEAPGHRCRIRLWSMASRETMPGSISQARR